MSGSEDKTALPYCDKLELMKEFLTRQVDKDEVEMKLGECLCVLVCVLCMHLCISLTDLKISNSLSVL